LQNSDITSISKRQRTASDPPSLNTISHLKQ
jgi:hypothetical protein